MEPVPATGKKITRKRKSEFKDHNERLSKRLSLLNLEQNGHKLYVPVEQPTKTTSAPSNSASTSNAASSDDVMQLDDNKHKVYIYNLDDELSDDDSSGDGKLVFLPDIEKHLRDTRIPASILLNSDGEVAGHNQQMVLYNVPTSLTVPEEQDSVRKAIIEARARARAKHLEWGSNTQESQEDRTQYQYGYGNGRNSIEIPAFADPMVNGRVMSGGIPSSGGGLNQIVYDDPDSMELD